MGYLVILSAVIAGTLFGDTITSDRYVNPFETKTQRCIQIEQVQGKNGPEYRCSNWVHKN